MTTSPTGHVKVQAILQARSGSTRLPGKIFEPIGDRSALGWAVARLKASHLIDRIVIATTTRGEDDRVENFAREEGAAIFRGCDEDVLDRFMGALKLFPAETIVRATGDNPLLDVYTLDGMIEGHIKNRADHTTVRGKVPIGTAAEVVSCSALEMAWRNTSQKPYREHVTPYIYENQDKFRVINIKAPEYLEGRSYRFTLDTSEDLAFLREVYNRLLDDKKPFDAKHATILADHTPRLMEINRHVEMKHWKDK